jgi:hypothetical protein
MSTEMGEYLVGAYLKLFCGCGVVDYNARPPGGGLAGLGELDVIGLNFADERAFLCEVATHLDGVQIGKGEDLILKTLAEKHARQREYAKYHLHLPKFAVRFMYWAPYVHSGLLADLEATGFELVVNERYTRAMNALRDRAKVSTSDTNNPAFRVLQILEHLRPVDAAAQRGRKRRDSGQSTRTA